jgi:hypothetical protein
LDHFYELQRSRRRPEDSESLAPGLQANWDPNLPKTADGFPDEAGFGLTPEEASYLRERLLISCPDSLLATLVDRCGPVEDVNFIWQHPQRALFPDEQKTWIDHACNFSEAMYGAVLLYNLMLAELVSNDELAVEYEQAVGGWWESLNARTAGLVSWDRHKFWELIQGAGRIPIRTRRFVDHWLDMLLSARGLSTLSHRPPARSLVREREIWLKRGRSRFESRRHLEMWSGGAGLGRLDYRWRIARNITNDILRGLE